MAVKVNIKALREPVTIDPQIITDAAGMAWVRALQAPDSPWPVKTGYSKANFAYRDSQLRNRAYYAPIVEQRTHAASQVWEGLDFDAIAEEAVREHNGS